MRPELLADLPTPELEELANTAHTILQDRYLADLKTVAATVLNDRMPGQEITSVSFGVDSWDNGYFYTSTNVDVATIDGRTHTVDLDGNDTLDDLLTNVSYDVGDTSILTVEWM